MRRIFLLMFVGLFLIIISPSIWAAEKSETEDLVEMEEMVVTSTLTEKRKMDVPSNIAVITSQDIEAMNARTLPDVIKGIPGAYFTNASGFEPRVSLRGTRLGMSEGAQVMLNGVPMSLGKFGYVDWDAIPIENIQRVEVVKGPLSSLYGGDAARGVINIVTKRSLEEIKGEISAIAGDYDDRRFSGLVYGSKNKFDYNLNVKKSDTDGYRKESSLDKLNFTGDIGYWLADTSRIGLFFNVADQEKYLAKKLTSEQMEEDRRQASDLSFTDTTDVISGINFKINKSLFDVLSTVYYKNRDKNYENYLKATSTPYKEDLTEDVWGFNSHITYKQPIAQLGNKLTFGFDYDRDKIDVEKNKAESKTPGVPYTKPDPKATGDFTRETVGVFVQDELSILDNLTLTAGVRYDYFAYDNNADYDFSEGGTYDYDEKPDFDKLNPRVGLNYRILEQLNFYASYNNAYRAPNLYDYYSTGSYSAKGGYTLCPEKFTQYEAGFRWAYSKWLNLDVSVYQIDIDDMLDSYYDEDGNYAGKQNVGKVDIKGFETSISGSLIDRIRYKIAYSYIDARYGDDTYARDADKNRVAIEDNRLAKWPYNTLNIDIDSTLLKRTNYDVQWHVGLRAQDEYKMDNLNSKEYKAYTLVDTKLVFNYKFFEAFAAVDNLFDREYDGYAYVSSGKDYYFPAPGRTWTAGLSYKF
ncbi:MAG: TonB-dependent receptor [Deltaproteobacteria bacterium]|nr:TonB-dependent receptor [Deltaproteobacteria bacterium]